MKFTMSDCVNRINQTLNYPSLTYGDVSHFFDQAVSELNTSLRIAVPSVSEMMSEHSFRVTDNENVIQLTTLPGATDRIAHYSSYEELEAESNDSITAAYVCGNYWIERKFYRRDGSNWVVADKLYGIHIADGEMSAFVAVAVSRDLAVWVPVNNDTVAEFDLTAYFPMDWWILFIIPYVCFKFAVRNGDSGDLFRDEFTQGFQQLQTSYAVPNTVSLHTVAGHEAYKTLVEINASNLKVKVPTRAVFDSMRIADSTLPIYGGFYESGGWGI